jgi:hypothetical protein
VPSAGSGRVLRRSPGAGPRTALKGRRRPSIVSGFSLYVDGVRPVLAAASVASANIAARPLPLRVGRRTPPLRPFRRRGHPASFTNQTLAKIELFTKPGQYERQVYTLPSTSTKRSLAASGQDRRQTDQNDPAQSKYLGVLHNLQRTLITGAFRVLWTFSVRVESYRYRAVQLDLESCRSPTGLPPCLPRHRGVVRLI